VLYHSEFEGPETAGFFQAAGRGKTALFRVGEWTEDFAGKPFDGRAALPSGMVACPDAGACATQAIARLRELGIAPQTPAVTLGEFGLQSAAPPAKGECRLLDGTHILVVGEKDAAGDPIEAAIAIKGRTVAVEAIGLAAVRLADDGSLEALAAGGLRRLEIGPLKIELEKPVDIAMWRDASGQMRGVLQDYAGEVPRPLAALTADWLRLAVPMPLAPAR
jgi:hypothetical protein